MMQAVEASLKRLQTEYIDLYWVHIWDGITPVEEVMRGLDDLVRQGKVLYVGISDAPAWWVAQANTLAELRGWTQFIGLQLEYSLIERTVERELIPMAKALNLGVLAFSPLAGGISNREYHGEGKPDDGRMTNEGVKAFYPEREQRAASMISAVKSVSEQTGRSMAQVALAWLRHRTVPVIPIIGARKVSQLQDNLASLDLELSAEQLKSLDGASRIEPGFPQSIYDREMVRAIRYGGTWESLAARSAVKSGCSGGKVMANELTLSVTSEAGCVRGAGDAFAVRASQRTEINRSAPQVAGWHSAGRAPCCSMAKKSARASHRSLTPWASRSPPSKASPPSGPCRKA